MKEKDSAISFSNDIWYNLMSSLIYGSILGTIIYSFIDNIVGFILHRNSALFLRDIGVNRNIGFTYFLFFSFSVIWHYCTDFLYTMYSKGLYSKFNFICDLIINFFLALSFILITDSFTNFTHSTEYIKISIFVFWGSLIIIYFIFFLWDYSAYRYYKKQAPNNEKAAFYKSMIFPFETSAISVYSILLLGSFIFIDKKNWLSFAYLTISLLIFFLFSLWFWTKLKQLEQLSNNE